MIFPQTTLNCGGTLVDLQQPRVMGIINVTPDSFFSGSRNQSEKAVLDTAERMLEEGTDFLDIGGMSSRPGAAIISPKLECERVIPAITAIQKRFPQALISIDTIQSEVARAAVESGAVMINDISAGQIDDTLFTTVAALDVPYVLMHMQGKPSTMQEQPTYSSVIDELLEFLGNRIHELRQVGVKDIIVDPGFGFGKTLAQNYEMLKKLHLFRLFDLPLMAGLSRKSMIYKLLDTSPTEALNGTTALHMIALQQGASILRVHDVKPAVEVVKLHQQLALV